MVHFFIGVLVTAVLWMLFEYTRKNNIHLKWWHWVLTILGLAYVVFVLELIAGFIAEGEPRAALVMGLVTGIVAIVWAVLMGRFVFVKPQAQLGES